MRRVLLALVSLLPQQSSSKSVANWKCADITAVECVEKKFDETFLGQSCGDWHLWCESEPLPGGMVYWSAGWKWHDDRDGNTPGGETAAVFFFEEDHSEDFLRQVYHSKFDRSRVENSGWAQADTTVDHEIHSFLAEPGDKIHAYYQIGEPEDGHTHSLYVEAFSGCIQDQEDGCTGHGTHSDGSRKEYDFCRIDDSVIVLPPEGLVVSSGDLVFGTLSPKHSCLAEAVRDNLTPKMHTVDDSFTDVTASLTFFQRTYYRDLQLCVRTQPFEKGGGPGDGIFTSTMNGYCCYLDTESATVSKLQIKHGALPKPLAQGDAFNISFGEDVLYDLEMSVTGSDIQCSILDKTHTALSTVSATDDDFVSGGISFMPFDGASGHHFRRLVIEEPAT